MNKLLMASAVASMMMPLETGSRDRYAKPPKSKETKRRRKANKQARRARKVTAKSKRKG